MKKNRLLSIKNLTVTVNSKTILNGINFDFEKGKIYAVMGRNGSGKTTLAYSIMGYPGYVLNKKSELIFNGENIEKLKADERSKKGIFLSFQSPLSLSGIKLHQLIQFALRGKKNPLQIREEIKKHAKELKIKEDLLTRSLNDGASGGEKKKLEVLQAVILDKELIILDEVDTGVDVDSLKDICNFLNENKKDKTFIIITHYNRILKYLKPDKVLVISNGQLKKIGSSDLAEQIENKGYGEY